MIKTAFRGRLKTTVTITFTLNFQFTASSGYAETGVYRVFENDLSMSVWDVLCDYFFLYSLSVSIYNNSINTGYKVYKVQKFDDISWQSADGSWTAEVVPCQKQNKTKNPWYSFVIMTISCRRGCTNILQFCHKMFSRNKMFAPQTVFFVVVGLFFVTSLGCFSVWA